MEESISEKAPGGTEALSQNSEQTTASMNADRPGGNRPQGDTAAPVTPRRHQWLDAWPFVTTPLPTRPNTLAVRVPSGAFSEFDLAVMGGQSGDAERMVPAAQAIWNAGFIVPAVALIGVFDKAGFILGLGWAPHRKDRLPGQSIITYEARVNRLTALWDPPQVVSVRKLTPADLAFVRRFGLGEEQAFEFELPVPAGRQPS
jgi:hypothetical protein